MLQSLPQPNIKTTFGSYLPEFLSYIKVDLRFSVESQYKYGECLEKIVRFFPDKPIVEFGKTDLNEFKQWLSEKNLSVSRQWSFLLSLKRYLRYLIEELELPVMDPKLIRIPKQKRKRVQFLTVEEVDRFTSEIPIRTRGGAIHKRGLRFRTLVEVLLGTGMRISEVLSLNRTDIDFKNTEAQVTGKGSKERAVFFTDRALEWINKYLATRTDEHPALFVREDGKERLKRPDVWRPFSRYRKLAGINKRVTPHMLRHTTATQLQFKGCPIVHIKEILGHERLETTCRYYLGLDQRAAKAAHRQFLHYSNA